MWDIFTDSRIPVKITVQVLAAGCQLSYRIFYEFLTVHVHAKTLQTGGRAQCARFAGSVHWFRTAEPLGNVVTRNRSHTRTHAERERERERESIKYSQAAFLPMARRRQ